MTAGFTELISGDMFTAIYLFFDSITFHLFIPLLFFTIQLIVYLQTDDSSISFTVGLFFSILFGLSAYMNVISLRLLLVVLAIEGAIMIYTWFK